MQTIKTANGVYKRLQMRNILDCGACVYNAIFIKNDGYTERRVVTVKNNKVLAWQSQCKLTLDNCVHLCYSVRTLTICK